MIANLLTGLRLLLAIPVAWACVDPTALPTYGLLGLVSLAIVTDILDGKIARKTQTATAAGMLFDHTTDFVFVTSALFAAAYSGFVSPWLPVLIVIAYTQYVLDSYWLLRQKQLRMSLLGRWNGIFYFAPVVVLGVLQTAALEAWNDGIRRGLFLLSFVLILSTLVSIVDRAIAPLRVR